MNGDTTDVKGAQARADSAAIQVAGTGFTMAGLAEVFVQSGFFRGVTGQAQAIVKVLYGQELGLSPLQSMLAINMVEGRPEVAAATLGAILKRSGKYDYRIVELSETGCTITFYEGKAADDVVIGTSSFTQDDATRAGLANKQNYRAYPEDMYFARAMSRGVKRFCLDALGGAPVYVTGELSEARAVAATAPIGEPETAVTPDNPYASRRRVEEDEDDQVVAETPPAANGRRRHRRKAAPVSMAQFERVDPRVAPIERRWGRPPEEVGTGDCETPGCWGDRGHGGAHVFEADAFALRTLDRGEAVPTTFSIGQGQITTQGMTEAQFLDSLRLATEVDAAHGKQYARGLLQRMLGVATLEEATRKDLTETMADHYLTILRQALEVDAP